MTNDQIVFLLILSTTVLCFIWGKWRHDVVAGGALMASVLAELIPGDRAFQGFGHPAVITVACVLILGYGLKSSGAVDVLARKALALLMPVAIQVADRHKIPHGKVLMPLAFGSILGG